MNERDRERHSAERGPSAIVLKDVSFGYDPAHLILRGLSLSIPRGQWISLVGSNGSGKSTLVKLLNGLLPASAGEIVVCGEKLGEDSIPAIRRTIGMVFQNPDNQFVGETVEEDILFGLEGLCLSCEEIDRRLRLYSGKLGVSGLLAKHPGELSGGQKQRVAIASILSMEPGVVIFDEASSMLDEESRNGLMDIMRDMHAEGYTIVAITHDADEIMASQRVLALSGGRLVGDMTPGELFGDRGLMEECRLHAPYAWQLGCELGALGLNVGVPASEKELIDTLWPFDCSK